VAQIAGELIAEHGSNAVYAAIARLNDAIDRNDRISRDFYAEIRVCNYRTGSWRFSFLIGAMEGVGYSES
jgi:hypothetical protein